MIELWKLMYHARYKDDVISFILLTTEGGDTSRIITVTLQLTGKSRLTVRLKCNFKKMVIVRATALTKNFMHMMYGSTDKNCLGLRVPIHGIDFQPQSQSTTGTKFLVYGLQQPQPRLVGRGCSCCRSKFSDIYITGFRFNWERMNRSVEVCASRLPAATATTMCLQTSVAVGSRMSCMGTSIIQE